MIADSDNTPTARPRSITAAAQKIDLRTRDGKSLVRSQETWQEEAWSYYDSLPEMADGAGFVGNSLQRIRLFPGVIVDPDEPPVPLADAAGEAGLPDRIAAAAEEEMARLDSGDGLDGIMQTFGLNLSIAGEGYLVGVASDDDNELADEEWRAYSSSAVYRKGDKVMLKRTPTERGRPLPDDAFVARIWRRHPRWPGLAHSNMRAALDPAEELLIYGRQLRAVAKSRANAGILLLPSELDPPPPPRVDPDSTSGAADPAAAGEGRRLTDLERGLVEALITPIEDDASAAAVAPFFLRGHADALEKVRLVDLARQIDGQALARIEALIKRLAHGLEVPEEVITGMSGVNHWTAWAIEDTTYKAYIEPLARVPAAGIASTYLRPALLEQGFKPEVVRRVVLGLDPSALVVRPNRAQDAKDAHDRDAISDEALRGALSFPESAAPSEEERRRRAEARRARRPSTEPAGQPDESTGGGEPTPDTQDASGLAAAGTRVDGLGDRLTGIEARLRDRLVVAASDAVTDALRAAGSRLRRAAQGNPELRQQVNGIAPEDVGVALGEDVGLTLADPDRLLDGAFDDLRVRWDAWVGQAQGDIAAVFTARADTALDPQAVTTEVDAYQAGAEDDRDAGWLILAALLAGLSRERLFAHAPAVEHGEFDPTVSVQAGVVRDALARTGGGRPGLAPVGAAQQAAPGGLSTGLRTRSMYRALGVAIIGYRWETGAPTHPFEPHHALAGFQFEAWDDPRLTNFSGWPRVAYFYPGDHRGCQCDAVPVVAQIATQEAA